MHARRHAQTHPPAMACPLAGASPVHPHIITPAHGACADLARVADVPSYLTLPVACVPLTAVVPGGLASEDGAKERSSGGLEPQASALQQQLDPRGSSLQGGGANAGAAAAQEVNGHPQQGSNLDRFEGAASAAAAGARAKAQAATAEPQPARWVAEGRSPSLSLFLSTPIVCVLHFPWSMAVPLVKTG